MKYVFATVFCAALLLAAVIATGHSLDLGSVIGLLCAAVLPAGLIWDYRKSPRGSRLPRLAQADQPQPAPARVAKPARPVVFTPPPLVPPAIAAPSLPLRRVRQSGDSLVPLRAS
ncbi:hypothetical protein [Opitutus terrae]|uniref:Uncharacterized protein n=1 Tax=Opitutus terrae (strain DSM 11246 / JCM 15787 / PB90-1) TaxID=452637 RepID=B1ZQX9_OPITP|nr:hypothetical protein [Opitutus terrae]ACB73646.1 hypothetical protein Oter_0356 [Opitutus terrae PB90-1]